ncbi:AraC family transcriptional regulator [Gracilibacillus sp. D59]|uniref:AraC family transcriptional regulator n=1 Tax=Gracilibacillus sp. D59 TaxID=3457434 RepID=UPI003FCDED2A
MKEYAHEYAYHCFFSPSAIERSGGLWPIRSGFNQAKPNFQVGPRKIDFYSLHFVLKGKGQIKQNDSIIELKEGDIFCLFPHHIHQYQTDPTNRLELFWLAFNGKQALALLNRLGLKEQDFKIDSFITPQIMTIVKEVLHYFQHHYADEGLIRLSLIYKLFHFLIEQASESNLTPNISSDWIEKSKQYMQTHFTEGLTVKDVADYVGFHRSHFTTAFSKEVGSSPVQYLVSLKMKLSTELMSDPTISITEVAYSIGYPDLYAFSRAFKNYYGISPKNYIKKQNPPH